MGSAQSSGNVGNAQSSGNAAPVQPVPPPKSVSSSVAIQSPPSAWDHIPVRRVYLELGCPFCNRVAAFIGAANLADKIIVEVASSVTSKYIVSQAGTTGYPALELAAGVFLFESYNIVEFLAKETGLNPDQLPLYRYFMEGTYPILLANDGATSAHTTDLMQTTTFLKDLAYTGSESSSTIPPWDFSIPPTTATFTTTTTTTTIGPSKKAHHHHHHHHHEERVDEMDPIESASSAGSSEGVSSAIFSSVPIFVRPQSPPVISPRPRLDDLLEHPGVALHSGIEAPLAAHFSAVQDAHQPFLLPNVESNTRNIGRETLDHLANDMPRSVALHLQLLQNIHDASSSTPAFTTPIVHNVHSRDNVGNDNSSANSLSSFLNANTSRAAGNATPTPNPHTPNAFLAFVAPNALLPNGTAHAASSRTRNSLEAPRRQPQCNRFCHIGPN